MTAYNICETYVTNTYNKLPKIVVYLHPQSELLPFEELDSFFFLLLQPQPQPQPPLPLAD